MSATVKITSISPVGSTLRVTFNLPLTGSYVAGGDTVDFTSAVQDAAFVGIATRIPASGGPISLDIWDAGGNLVNTVGAVKGTTQANCKVKFSAASTFGTEFSAGAYSAALLAATLQGEAVFAKLL